MYAKAESSRKEAFAVMITTSRPPICVLPVLQHLDPIRLSPSRRQYKTCRVGRHNPSVQSYLHSVHNALYTPPFHPLCCPASCGRSSSTHCLAGYCMFTFFGPLSFRGLSPIKAIEDRSLEARAPIIKFHVCTSINYSGGCYYLATEPLTVPLSNSGCVNFKAGVASNIESIRVLDTWKYSVSIYE